MTYRFDSDRFTQERHTPLSDPWERYTRPKCHFAFWVVLADGQEVRWPGLSASAARAMYQATGRVHPDNVTEYGYGEQV